MNYFKMALVVVIGCHWTLALAQAGGEASEPSPEALDAAFTSEDAAREAAAFSDEIIEPGVLDPLQAMAGDSNLVFRGRVKSQSYAYDTDGTPSTHTTIVIDGVIKGDYPDGEITLTQQGGPSQSDPDEVLMVSTAQYFNVGEEELLFLNVDPDNRTALDRAHVDQRFRIYQDKVYSEDGHGVILEPVAGGSGHRLALSRDRHPSKRFNTIRIGSHTLTKNFSDDEQFDSIAPSGDKATGRSGDEAAFARATENKPSYTESVDVSTFTAAIVK